MSDLTNRTKGDWDSDLAMKLQELMIEANHVLLEQGKRKVEMISDLYKRMLPYIKEGDFDNETYLRLTKEFYDLTGGNQNE